MIKTGRVGNIVLGVGDPSKFNLLGGSFGKAGDIIISGSGAGARIFIASKDKVLKAGAAAAGRNYDTPDPGRGGVKPRPNY